MKCLFCGGEKLTKVANVDNRDGGKSDIYLCAKCFAFNIGDNYLQNENVLDKQIKLHNEYWKEYEEKSTERDIENARLLVGDIKKYINIKEDEYLCEIGTGLGFISNELRKNYKNYRGCEPSEFLFNISVKNFKLDDVVINVDAKKFFQDMKGSRIGAIVMWHVLEHIPSGVEFVKMISGKLVEGGRYIIQIPYMFHNAIFSGHLFLATMDTIKFIENSTDLTLIDHEEDNVNFYTTFVFEKTKNKVNKEYRQNPLGEILNRYFKAHRDLVEFKNDIEAINEKNELQLNLLTQEHDQLNQQHDQLTQEHELLNQQHDQLTQEHELLNQEYFVTKRELDAIKSKFICRFIRKIRINQESAMSNFEKVINSLKTDGIIPTVKKIFCRLNPYYTPAPPIVLNIPTPPVEDNKKQSPYALREYPTKVIGKQKLKKVAFLIGALEGESKRYRVYNLIEGLNKKGINGCTLYSISENYEKIAGSDLLVVFRAAKDSSVDKIVQYAKDKNIPVVFDIDDLVFDIDILNEIDGISQFSKQDMDMYKDGVVRYHQTMMMCDYVTASTKFLVDYIEKKFFKEAYVISNTINFIQKDVAGKLENQEKELTIGYFSGSKTHNKDFMQASDALIKLMNEYKDLKFVLVGELDLPKAFEGFGDRVKKIGFMPYDKMVEELAGLYINIAPLEVGNNFAESKSELKIFEAALVGVPTVASSISSYSSCITNGHNGFTAKDTEEWYNSLKQLLSDKTLYEQIVFNLKELADRFYIDNEINNAIMIYERIAVKEQSKRISAVDIDNLKISWVVPMPAIGSGGHKNIFRAVRQLSLLGHCVDIYFTDSNKNAEEVKKMICDHFMPLHDIDMYIYEGSIAPCDVAFATHWSTVYPIQDNDHQVLHKFYFVQDYEPMFYPMGSEYILAENTYKMGFAHVTSGPWPDKILKSKYNANSAPFKFPLDRGLYNADSPRTKKNKNIIFFARPEMPRRCFDLGINALARVKAIRPDLEIILYGSSQIGTRQIPFEYTNAGIVPTLEDLNLLYRNADLGIVFSTTNPSLVPYEMMSSGLPVGDINLEFSVYNYGSENNVLLLDPAPEKMASQILEAIDNKESLKKIAGNAFNFINENFYSEEMMGKRIDALLKKQVVDGFLE